MSKTILVLNAGSSSIKFGLYSRADATAQLFAGEVEDIADNPHLTVKDPHGKVILDRDWPGHRKQADLLQDILAWADQIARNGVLAAVGHRIVHGGRHPIAPVRLDLKLIDYLARLTPMAPLQQEACLAPARTLFLFAPIRCGSGASVG